MPFFLGIDGGGTGCRAAIAERNGPVLGRAEGDAANIVTDPVGAQANIERVTRDAMAAAGLAPDLGTVHAALGLAGANVGEAGARLAARLPFGRSVIVSDALTGLRGAHGTADGITATLGTGSIFAVQREGEVRMLGGWGLLLGDHGSGARLGRSLLEAALLAHDGMRAETPLLRRVLDEAGGAAALVEAAQGKSPNWFARFAPRIAAAAETGDAAAEEILSEASARVADAIDALQTAESVATCFLGGLGAIYAARLSGRYPGQIRAPKGSALDGALALARDLA